MNEDDFKPKTVMHIIYCEQKHANYVTQLYSKQIVHINQEMILKTPWTLITQAYTP